MAERSKTYLIKVNAFEFTFTDDEIAAANLIKRSPKEFNLVRNHRSVNATLVETGMSGKRTKIEVEGEIFEVEIRDELDQVLEKMGFDVISTKLIKEIKAPMPGMILEITVEEGQKVNEGDKILILEAMKMENSIVTQANSTIKKIHVSAGQAVDKGQVLVELDNGLITDLND